MILKAGAISFSAALVLAIVVAAVIVTQRDSGEKTVAAKPVAE